MKKIIITLLLIPVLHGWVSAQDRTEKTKERERISTILREKLIRDDFKDTTMMYAFAFKVEVARDGDGGSLVKDVEVSDSSAYKLYKDFDFLKEIRYQLFMKDRKEATFILPVAVLLGYPGTENKYSQRVVSDVIQKLFFQEFPGLETPTEDYIYIHGLLLKTSTWVDY